MEDREYVYDDSDSDNEKYTPPNDLEISNVTSLNQLPQKSRKKYETVYKSFLDWRSFKNENSLSENVLLDYFSELASKYKPTSLWAHYSMLKSTLNLYENIDIERYAKLRSFLKNKSEGYTGKQAKTLTPEEIKRFIIGAPDKIYLATKVALIMGLAGACQANELYHMNLDDFEDHGSAVVVTVPKAKPKIDRTFTITGSFYSIYKKYANLNPNDKLTSSFFLNYQNGKCTPHKIGINKFGAMGKQVAKYLKLPHPELYTGHCFRKSSATMHASTGGDSAVRYIDDSIRDNMNSPKKINQTIENIEIKPSTDTSSSTNSSTFTQKSSITKTINLDSMPIFNFSNCSNFTININVTKPDV